MLARKHMPSKRSPMAGRRAGNRATHAIDGAKRAIESAVEAFHDAPLNDHSRDALAALNRVEKELSDAMACAAYLNKRVAQ